MTVRFRIRTPEGQELSFASREMFEDFVRAGDLSPDDLVYDGDTGSWSPARTHPSVLEIRHELEAREEALPGGADGEEEEEETPPADASEAPPAEAKQARPAEPKEAPPPEASETFGLSLAPPGGGEGGEPLPEEGDPEGETESGSPMPGSDAGALDDMGLDLALTEEPSAEETKRAFVEKLEAERRSEVEDVPSIRAELTGFTMEDSDTLGEMLRGPPPPRSPDPPPGPPRSEGRSGPRGRRERAEPARHDREDSAKKGGVGRVLAWLVVLVLLGVGGYYAYTIFGAADPGSEIEEPDEGGAAVEADEAVAAVGPVEATPEPRVEPETPPPPEPVISSGVAAVRERAQERYLTSTHDRLRDLQPIPDVWPEGPYLSVPSEHPGVVDVWQSYLTTIRDVRDTDVDRYRAAYQAALNDAVIEGEDRASRLQAGMVAFAETAPPREAHFERVEALASAAIQSHNALLEAEGLIIFDAAGSTGRPDGIGAGTSGRDSESQLILDQVIGVLEQALDADGEGPGSGRNVREWVWDGLLDAATRQQR